MGWAGAVDGSGTTGALRNGLVRTNRVADVLFDGGDIISVAHGSAASRISFGAVGVTIGEMVRSAPPPW